MQYFKTATASLNKPHAADNFPTARTVAAKRQMASGLQLVTVRWIYVLEFTFPTSLCPARTWNVGHTRWKIQLLKFALSISLFFKKKVFTALLQKENIDSSSCLMCKFISKGRWQRRYKRIIVHGNLSALGAKPAYYSSVTAGVPLLQGGWT